MSDRSYSGKSDQLYQMSNDGEYEEIIKHIRYHEDPHVRFGAAGVLYETIEVFKSSITPKAQKALVDAVLVDPVDEVRGKVVEILLELNEETIDNVIAQLAMDPDATPTDTPYPLILTHWHSSPHSGLQFLAVVGFGQVGNKSSKNKLRNVISNGDSADMDLRVLRRAIEEAGELGDELFVTPIQRQLRRDSDDFPPSTTDEKVVAVREAAVDALIEIGTEAAYEALVTASRSSDKELNQLALGEIGRFAVEDTVDLMIDKLDEKTPSDVRGEAAEGIITSFSQDDDTDEQSDIRERAIDLIVEETNYDVSKEFASVVDEGETPSEKRNAAWLIGQIDDSTQEAAEVLSEALRETDDKYLREIAAASLIQLDEDHVQPNIQRVLRAVDSDSETHEVASFVEENLCDGAQEAKRELVDYKRITDPSEYTTSK